MFLHAYYCTKKLHIMTFYTRSVRFYNKKQLNTFLQIYILISIIFHIYER